jgi:hypothetical protein
MPSDERRRPAGAPSGRVPIHRKRAHRAKPEIREPLVAGL